MTFKKYVSVFGMLLLIILLASCKATPVSKSSVIDKKLKTEVTRDVQTDIHIITEVTGNPSAFQGALVGSALETFVKQVNDDLAAGKVKIRRYENIKIKVEDVKKDLARVSFSFIDESHYVDKNNSAKSLGLPDGKDKSFALHLKKVDGRWKIAVVYPQK